ncbi:MAG: LytTR family DNA-binding domain-containing protein [Acidobacteriota bacterium]|nr:LytTR family DNA-binding domain-containing protein [Acidobacteriota bacterium]
MSLRVLIVDDEPLARRGIRARLKAFFDVSVVGECEDGEAALEAISRHSPDLVFLDVQMPGLSGFDVIGRLPKGRVPFVVFLTAYDQYALRAFEVRALDYLLKPIDDERFTEAVKRARGQIKLQRAGTLEQRLRALLAEHSSQTKPGRHAERFAIRTGTRIAFVLAEEIDWIEAAGDYAGLHVGKRTHLLRETLNSLETRLDPSRFVRIHRSTIVRASRIRELQALPNREFVVRLQDGTDLRASRSYRERLDRWLSET